MSENRNRITQEEASKSAGLRIAWGASYSAATDVLINDGYELPYEDMVLYRPRDLAARINEAIAEAVAKAVSGKLGQIYSTRDDVLAARIAELENAIAVADKNGASVTVEDLQKRRIDLLAIPPDSQIQSKPVDEHLADRGIFIVRAPK